MSLYHGIDCHSDNLVVFSLEASTIFFALYDRIMPHVKECYVLNPKIDASNKRVHIKSVSKESRKLAIHYLIQGLNHFRNSSPYIEEFYTEKRKGKSAGKVRMAVCRKIISYIYFC